MDETDDDKHRRRIARQTIAALTISAVLRSHGGIEHTDQLAALIAAALDNQGRLA